MSLPKDFLDKMQTLLKEEYEAFINSYEQEKSLGLRVNTLKTTLDQFETLNKFDLKSIPWVPEGYFLISKLTVQVNILIMKQVFIIFKNRVRCQLGLLLKLYQVKKY